MKNITSDMIKRVLGSAYEGKRYAPNRPWHDKPRYSVLQGKGAVLDPSGEVMWIDDEWIPNALTNTGQSDILNVYFKATTQTTTFYLGLFVVDTASTNAPSKTTVSANISQTALGGGSTVTEETTTSSGYARQAITNANWGTPTLNSGDEQTTAAQVTFGAASSAWNGTTTQPAQIKYAFLSTGSATTAGTLILYLALSGTTTINSGQSFAYTLTFKET